MAKTVCKILGVVFLLVGLIGFVSPSLLGAHLNSAHNVVHMVSGAVALYFGFAGSLAGSKDLCACIWCRLSRPRSPGIGNGYRCRSHVDAGTAALWPGRPRHSHPARRHLFGWRAVYKKD